MKYCGHCGSRFSDNDTYCMLCGAELKQHTATSTKSCSSCLKVFHKNHNFCISCGAHLTNKQMKLSPRDLSGVLRNPGKPKKCQSCNIHYQRKNQFCMHCGSSLVSAETAHEQQVNKILKSGKQTTDHSSRMNQSLTKLAVDQDNTVQKIQETIGSYEKKIKQFQQQENILREHIDQLAVESSNNLDSLRKEFIDSIKRIEYLEHQIEDGVKKKKEFSEQKLAAFEQRLAAVEEDKTSEQGKGPVAYAEEIDKTLASLTLQKNNEIRTLRQSIAALEKKLENKSDNTDLQDQLDIYWSRLKKLEDENKVVKEKSLTLDRLSKHVKELNASFTDLSLKKEMEIGQLRRQLNEHVHRMERMESLVWSQKQNPFQHTSGDVFSEKLLRLAEEQERRDIKTMKKELLTFVKETVAPFEKVIAEHAIEVKKLRSAVKEKSTELKNDIHDLEKRIEIDADRETEKQVAENTVVIGRLQKGVGKVYSQLASLQDQKKRWMAIIDKEIRSHMKRVFKEQHQEEKVVDTLRQNIENEFSKINVLLNHYDKRLEMFMEKTRKEIQDLREKKDPESFRRFAYSVVTELDEVKFRMKEMEHKAVHSDMEEIVDAIEDLERRLDAMRIAQPIVVE